VYGQQTNTPNQPYAQAALTSNQLIPGEQSYFIVRMQGGDADNRPVAPEVEGASINFVRSLNQVDAQRQITTAFLFRITPVNPGTFTIPPIALRSRGVTYNTPPLEFVVHPLSKLISLPTGIGKHNILAGWFPEKTSIYQGEQCPISLKLYIPQQLPMADNGWGLPDPEKENCLAWRFSIPKNNSTSQVTIDGTSYQSATFNTTLSGIVPGTATFGPAPLRLIVRQSVIDPLRGSRLINSPVNITLPKISFNILKLPDDAPSHFNGAIGDFKIQAECEQTTINEDEPTEVTLRIQGRGNLEIIQAPRLNDNTWKIIDTSKVTRGEERRHIKGSVIFKQLLRPESANVTTIPPYTLSYFNPTDKAYHTITTPPIPVTIIPSSSSERVTTAIQETTDTPPEEMRDILGFINRPNTETRAEPSALSRWHIIPALLTLLIISIPIRKKIKAARIKHPDTIHQQKAILQLSKESDQRTFYLKAGQFIEQWLLRSPHVQSVSQCQQELQQILHERDNLCFQPGDTAQEPVKAEQKKAILSLLTKCSKLTLCLFFVLTQITSLTADPDRDAWQSGNYEQALEQYQNTYPDPKTTPADILFNIGNCHHRLNEPGLAALAWRRALAIDPSHQQARQNLRYLEIDQNSLVPSYSPWQQHLTQHSPIVYQIIFQTSLWIFVLALLTVIILRPRGFKMTLCILVLGISPITATLGVLAQHWYPDDHLFSPPEKQAVAIVKTHLYQEAHRLEKSPRTIPAASLFRVEADRGPWTNIHTADEKSGWIPTKDLQVIHPGRSSSEQVSEHGE